MTNEETSEPASAEALRAIIEGRTSPPTDEEIAAHRARGGEWLVLGADPRDGAWVSDASTREDVEIARKHAVRWVAICDGRPCAWPTTDTSQSSPRPVEPADDWRAAPSPAEVAAHHAAHADATDVSRWVMLSKRDPAVVCVYTGRLGFLAHEDTRWRPCDATLTPVAWPVVRSEGEQ